MMLELRSGRMIGAKAHQRTQETYSPVGRRNLRMYWSCAQSTGAEMRKYFTAHAGQPLGLRCDLAHWWRK